MTSLRARSVAGIAALLLAAALSGCNDDEEPPEVIESTREPIPPYSSSPTEPPGPVEPTLPVEAEANTKAGVEAFVTFYWDVVNYATKTGDVELLLALAQPSCDGCDGGAKGIKRVYQRGGHIAGGEYRVVRMEPARSPSGFWTVVTHTHLGEQRTVGAGDLNNTFPGGRAKWLVGVAWVDESWSVSTLEVHQ